MTAYVKAPAKLTLSLNVRGRRSDGYHLIDAEMVSLDFADELAITDAPGMGLKISGAASRGVLDGGRNLVTRALVAVGRTAAVTLVKNIPAGAGLGGGSSDAAAVLRWASCRDATVAMGLGADVPYCVVGGRARVQGAGDSVEPLDFVEATFTLLMPPLQVPTISVYAAWDDMEGPLAESGNDLEPAALAVSPGLEMWRDRLGDATGRKPRLAGSGSTWFVDGGYPDLRIPGGRVVVARTVPSGWGD